MNGNEAMVEKLRLSGALRTPECITAFQAIDRGHFWVEGSGTSAYTDMPLRHGRLHQSAPHIYARALEALMPLGPGLSFLNVGCGTGYFSCLVGELLGESSVNDGIDIWPETLAHATERCRQIGKHAIEFSLGNVYELDLNVGMRYNRIYLGACASSRAAYLHGLLEVGGILVGPFQAGQGQQLRRVVRESETQFKVEFLNSVHFAPLVEPAPSLPAQRQRQQPGADCHEPARVVGLPGVPFTFALRQQPWTTERSWAYPASFRRVVATVLRGRHLDPSLPCLPPELWVKHVLPWCPRWWFEQLPPPPPPPAPSRVLATVARVGEAARAVRRALLFGTRRAGGRSGDGNGGYGEGDLGEGSSLLATLLGDRSSVQAAGVEGHPRAGRTWRRSAWFRHCIGLKRTCHSVLRHCAALRNFAAHCVAHLMWNMEA